MSKPLTALYDWETDFESRPRLSLVASQPRLDYSKRGRLMRQVNQYRFTTAYALCAAAATLVSRVLL